MSLDLMPAQRRVIALLWKSRPRALSIHDLNSKMLQADDVVVIPSLIERRLIHRPIPHLPMFELTAAGEVVAQGDGS